MYTDRTTQLHDAILDFFHETVSRFPPTHGPDPRALAPNTVGRVGEYLLQLGYLTPHELRRALHESTLPLLPRPTPLGYRLVVQHLVPPTVVIAVLLQQFLDRLTIEPAHAARFVGEQLLVEDQLEPAQLAAVLQEQLVGPQDGRWVRLGELIVRHDWLDPLTITAAVQHIRSAERA
jgi:hypothetical protein